MKGIFDVACAYVLWPFEKSFVFELELQVNTLNFAVVVKSLAIRIEKPVMQFNKNLLRRLLDAVCRLGQMGGKI